MVAGTNGKKKAREASQGRIGQMDAVHWTEATVFGAIQMTKGQSARPDQTKKKTKKTEKTEQNHYSRFFALNWPLGWGEIL